MPFFFFFKQQDLIQDGFAMEIYLSVFASEVGRIIV